MMNIVIFDVENLDLEVIYANRDKFYKQLQHTHLFIVTARRIEDTRVWVNWIANEYKREIVTARRIEDTRVWVNWTENEYNKKIVVLHTDEEKPINNLADCIAIDYIKDNYPDIESVALTLMSRDIQFVHSLSDYNEIKYLNDKCTSLLSYNREHKDVEILTPVKNYYKEDIDLEKAIEDNNIYLIMPQVIYKGIKINYVHRGRVKRKEFFSVPTHYAENDNIEILRDVLKTSEVESLAKGIYKVENETLGFSTTLFGNECLKIFTDEVIEESDVSYFEVTELNKTLISSSDPTRLTIETKIRVVIKPEALSKIEYVEVSSGCYRPQIRISDNVVLPLESTQDGSLVVKAESIKFILYCLGYLTLK